MTNLLKFFPCKKILLFFTFSFLSIIAFGAVAFNFSPVDDLNRFTVQPDESSATISWDALTDATAYQIYYVRESDGFRSQNFSTQALSYTFTGLEEGTYTFHVEALNNGVVMVIATAAILFLGIGAFFGKVSWG